MKNEKRRTRSLEQRIFEAYMAGKGLRLSIDDVVSLMHDDAMETRITNQACIEAGVAEAGVADVLAACVTKWRDFVERQEEYGS